MLAERVFDLLADEGTGRRGTDARNFVTHLAALTSTKIADGLISPKLVLAWLLSALGAPGYLIGALVPVREAGALLPQLAIAGAIQRRTVRKVFWAAGSFGQGAAALAMALAALTLEGAVAGWAIVGALAVLATARAVCSASYKDVLARTVPKGARGTVSGAAGTVGAAAVLAFAAALATGLIPREADWIARAIAVAGALWVLAALLFVTLDEAPDERGHEAGRSLGALAAPLAEDAELRRYLAVRMLYIATALAPPFLVMLSAAGEGAEIGNLGLMLIGSAAAAILSSYVWGRLSDRSSRRTLVYAGALAAAVFAATAAVGLVLGHIGGAWAAMAAIFAAQIAYEGTRAGRKTHLTDMDAEGRRTVYTALSNSLVGALLLAGGVFGVVAEFAGPEWVLAIFAVMAGAGAALALGLSEVQEG